MESWLVPLSRFTVLGSKIVRDFLMGRKEKMGFQPDGLILESLLCFLTACTHMEVNFTPRYAEPPHYIYEEHCFMCLVNMRAIFGINQFLYVLLDWLPWQLSKAIALVIENGLGTMIRIEGHVSWKQIAR